jgi:hypothetical protein
MIARYVKKIFNITNHQRNANQNHNETSETTPIIKRTSAGEDVEKW